MLYIGVYLFLWVQSTERGKGSGVWPSMVTHTWNLCSAFNPSKCTHTHTVVNIHPEQWAANAAAPREQLGVRCLAQGSHLSRGFEGGESAGYSLPPPTIPAGSETRTHDLRVTSPTLYPLGHDCPTNKWSKELLQIKLKILGINKRGL